MKKMIPLIVLFLAFSFVAICQTVTGPVLNKELVWKYGGEQKQGLAQGKGTANGTDTYPGDFVKGLHDGQGVYTDSQGNIFKGTFKYGLREGKDEYTPATNSTEKPLIGYWLDDKYVGKERIEPLAY
jgi:hypothetical protein